MAERRTIAKKISVSEQVNSLSSDFTRLLFTWMIPHADDYGVLSGSAWSIRSLVIPMLDHTNAEVEAALAEMEEAELLWRYSGPDKKPYVQFRSWEVHQSGLHKRTAPHAPLFHDPRTSDDSSSDASPEVPGIDSSTDDDNAQFPEVPGSSRKFPEVPASRARRTETKRNEEKRREPMRAADVLPTDEPTPTDVETPTAHSQTTTNHHPANPLWDALVATFGYEPKTKPERSKWGAIVKHLKEAHASSDDVRRAKANYDAGVALGVYTWSLTPNALDTHLGELLKSPRASPMKNGHRLVTAATASRPILTADDAMPEGY